MMFRKMQPGDTRRTKKWIFRAQTYDGVTKSWCRAEVVQMWSGGGTLTGYDYTPPGWITIGWGEFIRGVGHTKPQVSLVMPTTARAEIVVDKKDNEGAAIVWQERRARRPL